MTVTSIISYLGEGLLSARPSNPGIPADTLGLYYGTDTGVLYLWTGAAWRSASAVSGEAFSYTLAWGAGSLAQNGTIVLEGFAQAASHILGVHWENGVGAGSIAGAFQIGTINITGLSAVTNNGTGTTTATAANALSVGGSLRTVLSVGYRRNRGWRLLHRVWDIRLMSTRNHTLRRQ